MNRFRADSVRFSRAKARQGTAVGSVALHGCGCRGGDHAGCALTPSQHESQSRSLPSLVASFFGGLEVAGCVSRETQPLRRPRRACLRARTMGAGHPCEIGDSCKSRVDCLLWHLAKRIAQEPRKNRARRIPSGRSRFFVLSAIHVDDIHLPFCRTHPAVKPKPGKPSPVAHLRRIRSFQCARHVRRSPRPRLAFRIIPPSISLPPCALVSLLTSALDISPDPTGALLSRPCRLQRGASRCFT